VQITIEARRRLDRPTASPVAAQRDAELFAARPNHQAKVAENGLVLRFAPDFEICSPFLKNRVNQRPLMSFCVQERR